MEPITYEQLHSGEEQSVCNLVETVFNEFVAPDCETEGAEEFFRFANVTAMAERVRSGGYILVAKQSGKPVGMLEFMRPDRIAMLFVTLRGQGIAKQLVARAIDRIRCENPALSEVTVHASPYAEAIYQKMGFRRTGNPKVEHGIRYIPMRLSVGDLSRR